MKDGRCGLAKYYFMFKQQLYAMVILFEKMATFYQFTEVQKQNTVLVRAEEIVGKYILIETGSDNFKNKRTYIVNEPNSFERE